MSKYTRKADLNRHVMANDHLRRHQIPFCPGCGLYFAVNGSHRNDCTKGRHHA
jgi:hypothetical protein